MIIDAFGNEWTVSENIRPPGADSFVAEWRTHYTALSGGSFYGIILTRDGVDATA